MPRYVVSLGSSHPEGLQYIHNALTKIHTSTIRLIAHSRIYKNSSILTIHNHLFYNCAAAVTSQLEPYALFRELHALEMQLGRVPAYRYAPRTMDIDVLMSLDLVYMSSLFFLPHKHAWERNFFVIPAMDALRSAGWPLSIEMVRSGQQFGSGYLEMVGPLHYERA